MNNKQILDSVYQDFFAEKQTLKEGIEEEIEEYSIDELWLTEESKELLKKIVQYMKDYNEKIEKNYLSFSIALETKNKSVIEQISKILNYYANKYQYIDKSSLKKISLYKIEKPEDIEKVYTDNGVITISELEALNMTDTAFHKKFFYYLKEHLQSKKITIITDEKETIKSFLQEDTDLETIFSIHIIEENPSVNDVYNELLEKIDLTDELKIKVLDYITETYPKTEKDYSTYLQNLQNYISFNKQIPELEKQKSNEEVFKELNELVGLKKVKDTLQDLVNLITLKNKTKEDLKINNINLHMVFLGNPGTGKTTVARLISDILYNLKYIKQNKLIEVSSKDLVAEYVGQTAVKTMNVIEKAMGGILFIDEAYALADKDNENSYNGECIATLIKAMEDYRDNLVVIFAGYTKEMQDFLDSNSGIVSRIGYTLEFDDYTNEELKEIFKRMVEKAGFILEEDAQEEVEKLINENRNMKNFGNARFIRNMYEKTIIKHASNTKNIKRKQILKTIKKVDITI